MDERQSALLEAVRALPARTVAATMRNPRSSADRVFRGPALHDFAVAQGLAPAALSSGEMANRYFLVTAEDGARSAVAFAEVWPGMAQKEAILAYEQDGEPVRNGVRLVITGDYLGGRSIAGVVSVEAKSVQAAPAERALSLAGLLDRPGEVNLEALPAEARGEVETLRAKGHNDRMVPPRRYTGARIYALLDAAGIRLDPEQHEDFLGKVVVVSGADGHAAVIAGGEIEPRFMDGAAILATSRADEAGDEVMPRLVLPFDLGLGRWVKGVHRIELRQA